MEKEYKKINNAVIDLGSNSIRMLIFRRGKDGKLQQVNRSLRYTKLAQDVSKTGLLSEDAINRNLHALSEFQKIATDYDVHHVYLFATNAMREAKNADVLVNKIREDFGLDVHIISGEEEAEYGFIGVSQTHVGEVLIFDIGGGSTELIYGDTTIKALESLPLGCVRCSDDFIKDQNAITKEEVDKLADYSYKLVRDTLEKFNLSDHFDLIGIGGTITTLASLVQGLTIYDSSKIHQTVVTYEQMQNYLDQFIQTNLKERSKIQGLPEKRVDTITAGTVIAMSILKAARKTRCRVCDFDNLEGAAYTMFLKQNPRDWDTQTYKIM